MAPPIKAEQPPTRRPPRSPPHQALDQLERMAFELMSAGGARSLISVLKVRSALLVRLRMALL